MIIWGWRTITHSAATGEFYCPECTAKQPYTHQKIRRWFTLYFIPIIPLSVVGEQVKCKRCSQTWKMSVLEHDPEKAQSEQLKTISVDWFNAMSALVGSVGKVDQQVGEAVVADIASATGWQYGANDVMAKATANRDQGVTQSDVLARLGNLSATLSSSGKEMFLVAALNVLRMTTNCGPDEITLVQKIGSILGTSEAHIKGILLEAGLPAPD
jgi:hypothetical protein